MKFVMIKKLPHVPPAIAATSLVAASSDVNALVTEAQAQTVPDDAAVSHSPADASAGPGKSDPMRRSCEGIFPDYEKKQFQDQLNEYILHATINATSLYEPKSVGNTGWTNLFMRTCNGKGILRETKNGNIHSCNDCHILFYVSICIAHRLVCLYNLTLLLHFLLHHGQCAKSLKATIKDRAKTFSAVHTILK
jgi:hypothetical protein